MKYTSTCLQDRQHAHEQIEVIKKQNRSVQDIYYNYDMYTRDELINRIRSLTRYEDKKILRQAFAACSYLYYKEFDMEIINQLYK